MRAAVIASFNGGADIVLSTTSSAQQISSTFDGLRPGRRFINMGLPEARSPSTP